MARKKAMPIETPKVPMLTISVSKAEDSLKKRIDEGNGYLAREISNIGELEVLKKDFIMWNNYNADLLLRIFNNATITDEYKSYRTRMLFMKAFGSAPPSFREKYEDLKSDLNDKVDKLIDISRRLELFENKEISVAYNNDKEERRLLKKIFIVHGHDEEMKQTVARVVEKIDFESIVLHEKPNQGRTIIEKFVDYSEVGFAVVLLSPDDIGYSQLDATKKESTRARQNVILELGFFLGKLNRERVMVLYREDEDFEFPSDYSGVLYTPFDEAGHWKFGLAKELKSVGYEVDVNKLL
jgi:predicted nucleotide-binding protein